MLNICAYQGKLLILQPNAAVCGFTYVKIKNKIRNEKDFPTLEPPQNQQARLPSENGHQERPQGTGQPSRQGPSLAVCFRPYRRQVIRLPGLRPERL